MSELRMRQGTIYEEPATGKRWLLFHHNPMNLQSLAVCAAAADAPFDLAHPELLDIDALIAWRRSGQWRELGDLPPENLPELLRALLAVAALSAADRHLVEGLLPATS